MNTQDKLEERILAIRTLAPEAERAEIYCKYAFDKCLDACFRVMAKALSEKTLTLDESGKEYEFIGYDSSTLYFLKKGFKPNTKRQKEDWEKYRDRFGNWNTHKIWGSIFYGSKSDIIQGVNVIIHSPENILRLLRTGFLNDYSFTTLHSIPIEDMDPVLVELALRSLDSYMAAYAEYEKPYSVIKNYVDGIGKDMLDNFDEKFGNGKANMTFAKDGIPNPGTYRLAGRYVDYSESDKSIELQVFLLKDCDNPAEKERELIEKLKTSDENQKRGYYYEFVDLKNNLIEMYKYKYDLTKVNVAGMIRSLTFKEFKQK